MNENSNSSDSVKLEEERFLKDYNIDKYERPSVTTDIAVFTIYTEKSDSFRKDPRHRLAVLLIKRGEHPFKEMWALPGGFLRKYETLEQCAAREISEETGVKPKALLPIGMLSEPNRDPRGWIISEAFASVISENKLEISGGDDASDAKWFDVDFEYVGGKYLLKLSNGETILNSVLSQGDISFGKIRYETESTELSFDHAKIIATALTALRRESENYDVIFEFLPEKFTLTALQTVKETLSDEVLLTANFRRKIASLVEETDGFTEGAGHRPARLYTRKK